ncbi:MAG: glycosyltransferase [Flavobacterium sp.]
MKILYITPTIYDEGGVSKVLALKTNYLIEQFDYEIYVLTSNNDKTSFFHPFNTKTKAIDLKTKGFKPFKIIDHYKKVNQQIEEIKPDLLVLCDFGWKGFCFNFFVKTKIPLIFEVHGSIFNETKAIKFPILSFVRASIRKLLLKMFRHVVFLSSNSQKEWEITGNIIPNPMITNLDKSELKSTKVIAVARHSYEKGVDRLLSIWQKIISVKPEWTLDIYGEGIYLEQNKKLASDLNILSNTNFYKPVKNINDKYLESSVCLMTSRQEGFPMVLLEAMSVGLPIVAYDCPIGPRSIITNEENGFLIEDGNEKAFVAKTIQLLEDYEVRKRIGNEAKMAIQKYNIDAIMKQWNALFMTLTSK